MRSALMGALYLSVSNGRRLACAMIAPRQPSTRRSLRRAQRRSRLRGGERRSIGGAPDQATVSRRLGELDDLVVDRARGVGQGLPDVLVVELRVLSLELAPIGIRRQGLEYALYRQSCVPNG